MQLLQFRVAIFCMQVDNNYLYGRLETQPSPALNYYYYFYYYYTLNNANRFHSSPQV